MTMMRIIDNLSRFVTVSLHSRSWNLTVESTYINIFWTNSNINDTLSISHHLNSVSLIRVASRLVDYVIFVAKWLRKNETRISSTSSKHCFFVETNKNVASFVYSNFSEIKHTLYTPPMTDTSSYIHKHMYLLPMHRYNVCKYEYKCS